MVTAVIPSPRPARTGTNRSCWPEAGSSTIALVPPLEIPAGGGTRRRGRDHLPEGVSRREHRVGQSEYSHSRVAEGLRPAEGLAQLAGHPVAVMRNQGHLAQARSGEHVPASISP